MNMRLWAVLAASAVTVGLAAGCSSHPAPHPASTNPDSRLGDAAAVIVQCALTRGLMKPPTGLTTPAGQTPFVKGTKLVLTSANGPAFSNWYNSIAGTKIAGGEVAEWVQQTADSGKLPAAVCGTSVTASELQKQVFASDPAAGDPWS